MIAVTADTRFTLDTNILVYSVDRTEGLRHDLSRDIVVRAVRGNCWLTLQAISEFYSAVTRKRIMLAPQAAALAETWLTAFRCAPASPGAVRRALTDARLGRASYWDALLVATADEIGCNVVLTEDLTDGAIFGGITVHHPFAPSGGLTERASVLLGL
jgi:predicted nucleic acid-binding protein